MNIHEYQAKAVLKEFGVPVPKGIPAFTPGEAVQAAEQLGGPVWVVKAQIHAGGRGKAGGVKVVKTIDDVKAESTRILGSTLVTHQTGPHGKKVNRLYIEEGSAIDREFYLSALIDRETSRVAFVVSTEGGMDIEEVAHKTPEKIVTFALDGSIGCMVNGAGLAMATMDIIKLYGMAPANFLDVGGSATKEKVTAAFKIITSDPSVKGILVNIFGGIMKCDVIAEGVVAAVKEVGLKVPLVVRLEGTNVEKGKEIIAKSNLNVTSADDLDDAAQKIVKAVKGT